ncbi:chymotrypsin-like protease CTRL-1 [Hyalella azteca]|uniref:Chymotrypsin-like protease CTRL-1 n=1 Tax=Hyalella azteca TaxID=294128 RepID=A0A8B7NGM7_HYAAZ|nr:chymotrypsin-like protease CTRL-1 [Hyalella azteca]
MKTSLTFFVTLALWCEVKCCNQTNIDLQPDEVYQFTSVDQFTATPGAVQTCVFEGSAPVAHKIYVLCNPLTIIYDYNCRYSKLLYSPSGDPDYADAVTYCGYRQTLNFTTVTNKVALKFINAIPDNVILPGYICFIATPIKSTAAKRNPTSAESFPEAELPPKATSESNCDCGLGNPEQRDGAASIAEHPWMAGIFSKGRDTPFCGGSLISKQWVLTAAHCVLDEAPDDIEVVLGTNQARPNVKSGRRVKVSRIITNPNYDANNLDNNIALLKMAAPVTYSKRISPVCLPYNLNHSDYEGSAGTITVWGGVGDQEPSEGLEEDDLIIIRGDCFIETDGFWLAVTDNMFCTVGAGKFACNADSGGPLTVQSEGRHIQLGIGSWSLSSCSAPPYPGIYTKVTNFLPWIEKNTKETFCKVN